MNVGIGNDWTRDRLPLRGVVAAFDTLLYLGRGLARAFSMGRGPECGVAAMGLPRRRRRAARRGKGRVLRTEYMLNPVICDALASQVGAHSMQEKITPFSKVLATMGMVLVLAGCPGEVGAETITPDDVYRAMGAINGDLEKVRSARAVMGHPSYRHA